MEQLKIQRAGSYIMIRSLWDNCPAKAIMYRSISIIYDGTDKEFERIMPRTELLNRYGLAECEDIWQRMSQGLRRL